MPRNIAAFFPPPTDAGTLSLLLYYNSRRKANEIENIPQIRHLFFTCARGFGATMSQERRRSCATSARGTLPSSRTLIQYRLFMWYPGATPAYVSHSICDSAGSHFTFRANSLPSPPPNVRSGTQKQMPNHLRLSLRRSSYVRVAFKRVIAQGAAEPVRHAQQLFLSDRFFHTFALLSAIIHRLSEIINEIVQSVELIKKAEQVLIF